MTDKQYLIATANALDGAPRESAYHTLELIPQEGALIIKMSDHLAVQLSARLREIASKMQGD